MKTITNLINRTYKNAFVLSSVLVLTALLITACSEQTAATTQAPTQPVVTEESAVVDTGAVTSEPVVHDGKLPMVNPLELSGDIIMAGSSTVYPLAEAMALRFEDEGFTSDRGNITIDSIGSGAGFERFCVAGESDIANASRPIKDSEIESCRAIGREPIEFRVGTDALAIVVSHDNTFLTNVTIEELANIYSSDAALWSDINTDWPAEQILRYSPGTDSGTFDYFVEVVMTPTYGEEGENIILNSSGLQQSEDDNQLVQGVTGSPYAIGYFGFAYYQENSDILKILNVNGIEPNETTAENNEYPLSRPLFLYSDATIMKEKPQVAAFLNFFISYMNEEILRVGYFPASAEALDEATQAWLDALK